MKFDVNGVPFLPGCLYAVPSITYRGRGWSMHPTRNEMNLRGRQFPLFMHALVGFRVRMGGRQ